MRFRIKVKNEAGDRGYGSGGGCGGDEATPPTPPRLPLEAPPTSSCSRDPTALPTSRAPLQPRRPPRPPADKDRDGRPNNEDWGKGKDDELEDDEDAGLNDEDLKEEKLTGSSDKKIPIALFMSSQREDLPHDILRHDSVTLSKNDYFSLQQNWNQLLDGKRTYLRRSRDYHVHGNGFKCPGTYTRSLGRQKRLLDLVQKHSKPIFLEKIKILGQHYVHFRRTRGDGSCFYRAFLFSYLENLGQMQGSQSEVTRLMEHVPVSRKNFCRLKWDKAYFLNPEEYFSAVFSEFSHFVNSVANGLSSDELFKRSIKEIRSLRKTEIRTREDEYKSFLPGKMDALLYCCKELRPMDVEASVLSMRALTNAPGIPLRVESVAGGLRYGIAQVQRLDFFPRSGSGKGRALHFVQSYWSSIPTPKPLELGSGNLLSSDGAPLLTLMRRPKHCDILYHK